MSRLTIHVLPLPPYIRQFIIDVGFAYEYNFLPYGTVVIIVVQQRLSPYAMIGLGATYVNIKGWRSQVGAHCESPIGLVKYKVNERMNVGLNGALHFSLSDELDGQKDHYGIKSSGLFKNTDSYSTLQLTFSYSFMAKCKTCHNEDEVRKLVSTYYIGNVSKACRHRVLKNKT